jgi:hypothetical protein
LKPAWNPSLLVQADAAKLHITLFAWIVRHDRPPDKFIARFATAHPTVYIMVADTLTECKRCCRRV